MGEESILAIPAAPDKSSMSPRGWGEPWVWDLIFSWFLTLPVLILGHSNWMLSPCSLFHEPPNPSVAHVDYGAGMYRESPGEGAPSPELQAHPN